MSKADAALTGYDGQELGRAVRADDGTGQVQDPRAVRVLRLQVGGGILEGGAAERARLLLIAMATWWGLIVRPVLKGAGNRNARGPCGCGRCLWTLTFWRGTPVGSIRGDNSVIESLHSIPTQH